MHMLTEIRIWGLSKCAAGTSVKRNACCKEHSWLANSPNCSISGSGIMFIPKLCSTLPTQPIFAWHRTPLTGSSGLGTHLWPGWSFLRTMLKSETLPRQSSLLSLSFHGADRHCHLKAPPVYSCSFLFAFHNKSLVHLIPSSHLLLKELAHKAILW